MTINFREFSNKIKNIERRTAIRSIEEGVVPDRTREHFFNPYTFRPGTFVREGECLFEILEKCSNYLVVCDENGVTSRKFVDKLVPTNERIMYRKGTFRNNEIPNEQVHSLIEVCSDPIAIIKAIRLFNEGKTDLFESHLKKFGIEESVSTSDQLTAAKILAGAIGSSTSGSASDIINSASSKLKSSKINSTQRKLILDMISMMNTKLNMKIDVSDFEEKR